MGFKLASFNVNGIRARLEVVLGWVKLHQPDVLCLQEIKCQDEQFPTEPFSDAGYIASIRGQKSFNGVAILSRPQPSETLRGFDDGEPDEQARLIAVRFENLWIVNTYVPQGRDPGDPAFLYKLGFLNRLKHWFNGRFSPFAPLVWTGDMNVAPGELDVFDPKRLNGKIGFHPAERQAFGDVASWGFVDLFRNLHPSEKQFTFWDYRIPASFSKNLGLRIDHIMVTEPMNRASIECRVDTVLRGAQNPSDHTPIWANFDLGRLDR